MDKNELKHWMGAQEFTGDYSNVRIVVHCASYDDAQLVGDVIRDICSDGRSKPYDRFDPSDGFMDWWPFLFLYDSPSNEDRCVNAFNKHFSVEELPAQNADVISCEEFFAAVFRRCPSVEDLL